MRRQLREHLGIVGDSQDEIPNIDVGDKTGADTYLNRSFWELGPKFDFREKEVVGTFTTVEGTNYYKTPTSFEAMQNLDIEDLNDFSHKPLDRITRDVFSSKYENRVDSRGKPELYFREDTGIRLWPTPDGIYTLTIKYLRTLADVSDSNLVPGIPQEWHEIILLGGVWRAMLGVNRDVRGARDIRAFQASLMEGITVVEVKEEIDSHRAGLEVLGLDSEL
jgi:hypothetical protein